MSQNFFVDTSTYQNGTTLSINIPRPYFTGRLENKLPGIVFKNDSGCIFDVKFSGGREISLSSGEWTDVIPLEDQDTSLLLTVQATAPNAPFNILAYTIFKPTEKQVRAGQLGNSPIAITGNVNTGGSGGTSFVKNDANTPPVSVIEATPSDQVQSSLSINNDASGFLQVLSANVLRKILNIVRGNNTSVKAVVDIGDAGDLSITTFHGTLDNAVTLGSAKLNAVDNSGSGYTELQAPQNPGTARGIAVTPYDGAATHFRKLYDANGNFQPGVPVANLQNGTLPAGVNIPAAQVNAGAFPSGLFTFTTPSDQGNPILFTRAVATSTNNADLIELKRTGAGTAGDYELGIDQNGEFYIYDLTTSTYVLHIAGKDTVSGENYIPVTRHAGATPGQNIWCGTTDVGGSAQEGDLWAPA